MPPRKHTHEYLETQVALLKEELDSQLKLYSESKKVFQETVKTLMRPQMVNNMQVRSENLQLRAKIARMQSERYDMAKQLHDLTGDKKWLKYLKPNSG